MPRTESLPSHWRRFLIGFIAVGITILLAGAGYRVGKYFAERDNAAPQAALAPAQDG